MTWTFNGIRIFPQDKNAASKPAIARLQPIEGGTILQFFGHEDAIHNLSCLVVGNTDIDALKALVDVDPGTSYTLLGYGTDYGDFFLASLKYAQKMTVWQSIRPDLDCESPIFDVDLELYEDV